MKRRDAGALIAEALREEGIDTGFGLIGTHVVELYDALARSEGFRLITATHEGNAGLMAEAYARVARRPVALLGTAGPGFLNAVNPLAQAWFSCAPVINITGGIQNGGPTRTLHALDDEAYTATIGAEIAKMSERPGSIGALKAVLPKLMQAARSHNFGPVHIEIPWDVMLDGAASDDEPYARLPSLSEDGADALAALRHAGQAHPIVFCLDQMVQRAGVERQIITVAERLGASVLTTYDAFGAIATRHPLFGGVISEFHFGSSAFAALKSAAAVLAFGVDAGSESDKLIAENLAPGAFYERLRVTEKLAAGLTEFSNSLTEPRPPVLNLRQAGRELHDAALVAIRESDSAAHIGAYAKIIADGIGGDDIIVLDAGSHEIWMRSLLRTQSPSQILGSGNFGTMGYALPGVIGAKIAAPDRKVVGVTGDGCFLMASADLLTFAKLTGSAVLVVLNNCRYDEIARVQKARNFQETNVDIPRVDFSSVARAYGIEAYSVTRPQKLDAVLRDALEKDRPVLIDALCDPGTPWPQFR
jgi:acetolactate synthase-1/2/3 large subunit